MEERMVTGESQADDASIELSLRPTTFKQYIGQKTVKQNSLFTKILHLDNISPYLKSLQHSLLMIDNFK